MTLEAFKRRLKTVDVVYVTARDEDCATHVQTTKKFALVWVLQQTKAAVRFIRFSGVVALVIGVPIRWVGMGDDDPAELVESTESTESKANHLNEDDMELMRAQEET